MNIVGSMIDFMEYKLEDRGRHTKLYWSNVLTVRFSIPYKNQTKENTSF